MPMRQNEPQPRTPYNGRLRGLSLDQLNALFDQLNRQSPEPDKVMVEDLQLVVDALVLRLKKKHGV